MKTVSIVCRGSTEALVRTAAAILRRRLCERTGIAAVPAGKAECRVVLTVRPGIGTEGFRIKDGPAGEIVIAGNDPRGVMYGVGKFLRDCRFEARGFVPAPWRGESVPVKPVRGMYFASHFHNFYHNAPIPELVRYVEDLALWGCNALSVWFDMHHYAGIRDPEAQRMVRRLTAILAAAQRVGISPAHTSLSNEGFSNSPKRLRADWTAGHDGYFREPGGHYHVEVCPNQPGGLELILKYRRQMIDAFKGIEPEYFWIWPYDQGGCTCSRCTPWGSNGFLKTAEAVAGVIRAYFPRCKIILSTWYFDHFVKGEWEGLDAAFRKHQPDWVDYILADDYGTAFPEYVLKHGVPGGYPLLTFPEISMFNMWPWGGFGMNPQPARFQQIWDSCRDRAAGGFPYSEGIFEDMNKAIMLQFYWAPQRPALETVAEYIAAEFSPAAVKPLVRAVQLMEQGGEHWLRKEGLTALAAAQKDGPGGGRKSGALGLYGVPHGEGAKECLRLVNAAEKRLLPQVRKGWRWRLFRLRAVLDAELQKSGGAATALTEKSFREIAAIYHAGDTAEASVAPPTVAVCRRFSGAWV